MRTETLIEKMRKTHHAAYDVILENYRCQEKMHEFLHIQSELRDCYENSVLASNYEVSEKILQEMNAQCKSLEAMCKTIEQILGHLECAELISIEPNK